MRLPVSLPYSPPSLPTEPNRIPLQVLPQSKATQICFPNRWSIFLLPPTPGSKNMDCLDWETAHMCLNGTEVPKLTSLPGHRPPRWLFCFLSGSVTRCLLRFHNKHLRYGRPRVTNYGMEQTQVPTRSSCSVQAHHCLLSLLRWPQSAGEVLLTLRHTFTMNTVKQWLMRAGR